MCYSAQVVADYREFQRKTRSKISFEAFFAVYSARSADRRLNLPKAMDAAFAHPDTDQERQIKALIDAFDAQQTVALEQELFKQRTRLADAERQLARKPTKGAADSQRIATSKIEWALGKLADLKRKEPLDRDSRIFPGWYVPVLVVERGQRVIKPMRYQCRPAGKPAFYDTKYPGSYNARRDSLEGFWKGLFGHTHGIVVLNAFYENVDRPRADGTSQNVVLEFRPEPPQDMLVACLWSRWSAPGQPDLLSFAAITDEPPPEVAAAGHDRCVIPIRPEHVDAWLNPDPNNLAALYAILDDRERPHFEHRLAA